MCAVRALAARRSQSSLRTLTASRIIGRGCSGECEDESLRGCQRGDPRCGPDSVYEGPRVVVLDAHWAKVRRGRSLEAGDALPPRTRPPAKAAGKHAGSCRLLASARHEPAGLQLAQTSIAAGREPHAAQKSARTDPHHPRSLFVTSRPHPVCQARRVARTRGGRKAWNGSPAASGGDTRGPVVGAREARPAAPPRQEVAAGARPGTGGFLRASTGLPGTPVRGVAPVARHRRSRARAVIGRRRRRCERFDPRRRDAGSKSRPPPLPGLARNAPARPLRARRPDERVRTKASGREHAPAERCPTSHPARRRGDQRCSSRVRTGAPTHRQLVRLGAARGRARTSSSRSGTARRARGAGARGRAEAAVVETSTKRARPQ
jgi:hypothetical protein